MKEEYLGFGSIERLRGILDHFNARRVFLVTGKTSFRASGAEDAVMPMLTQYRYCHYVPQSHLPQVPAIIEEIPSFKTCDPDVVVAIGGGHVLDTAKALNVLAFQSGDVHRYVSGELPLEQKGAPLIAVPTTAGTGSEYTRFAIVYDGTKKYSLAHEEFMLPEACIVDPGLMRSVPVRVAAETGLDALCQAIESYWSVASNEVSRGFAKEAITLAMRSLIRAVRDPDDESRLAMAKAASLSGKAINITKTTAAHALSYPLSTHFGIAHGHAVALTLQEFLPYNYHVSDQDCNDPRGAEFVRKEMEELIVLLGAADIDGATQQFRGLIEEIGLEGTFSKCGIAKEDIPTIIQEGFSQARMANNPRMLREQDISQILNNLL
jgi:alcohol dehydrogenase class IV